MKNKNIFMLILAIGAFSMVSIYAFKPYHTNELSTTITSSSAIDSTETKSYTCPMHPEVVSDKPGTCPKCGMDLVLKQEKSEKDETKHNDHKHHKGCMGH